MHKTMKLKTKHTITLLATGITLASHASAASLLGLFDTGNGSYSLGAFDSSDTTNVSLTNVSGVAAGESLNGLDFRPATGDVYAIGSLGNVYTMSLSGVATNIGSFSSPVPGSTFGFDFNPAFMSGTFARIISDSDDNRVISGEDGSYLEPVEKTDVFFAAGDVNVGENPNINHIAYTNSILGATATQQYGIDTTLDVLVTVANNAGTLETVGALPFNAGELGGFDIDGLSGEAFLGFQDGAGSDLYSINLSDGSATSLGSLNGDLIGLTAIPEPSSALLGGLAGLGFLLRRRR
jgi:hypothetical protein